MRCVLENFRRVVVWCRKKRHKHHNVVVDLTPQEYVPTLERTEKGIKKLRYGVKKANELLEITGADYRISMVRRSVATDLREVAKDGAHQQEQKQCSYHPSAWHYSEFYGFHNKER